MAVGVMKTEFGTGSPVRLLALVNEDDNNNAADKMHQFNTLIVIAVAMFSFAFMI